jgi:Flp pilus assembly protein TadG
MNVVASGPEFHCHAASFVRDRRGVVYLEFLVAFLPIFTAFLCIAQLTDLAAAKLIVQHAAYRAARAGAVVFPDDPAHYQGPTKLGDVETAAYMVLTAKGDLTDAAIDVPSGTEYEPGDSVTIVVRASYACRFPIANRLVCPGLGASATRELRAEARMPAHAAAYPYEAP